MDQSDGDDDQMPFGYLEQIIRDEVKARMDVTGGSISIGRYVAPTSCLHRPSTSMNAEVPFFTYLSAGGAVLLVLLPFIAPSSFLAHNAVASIATFAFVCLKCPVIR
jgi:hypothetical protein